MEQIISRLTYLAERVPEHLKSFSELELAIRPAPGKWSKKEIIGHLCDSAMNNLSRFIKVQIEEQPFVVVRYEQDQWVKLQNYQEVETEEILQLWKSLNQSMIRVISGIPEEKIGYTCELYNGDVVTLEWMIRDYVEHMEHHLGQVFPGFTHDSFGGGCCR